MKRKSTVLSPKKEPSGPLYKSKWGRVNECVAPHFPISRSTLYEILDADVGVRSFVLKDNPKNKFGVRLVDVESLENFLDRQAELALGSKQEVAR